METGIRAIIPESGGQTKKSRLTHAGGETKGMRIWSHAACLMGHCGVDAESLPYAVLALVYRSLVLLMMVLATLLIAACFACIYPAKMKKMGSICHFTPYVLMNIGL